MAASMAASRLGVAGRPPPGARGGITFDGAGARNPQDRHEQNDAWEPGFLKTHHLSQKSGGCFSRDAWFDLAAASVA
jgi:hypothetical protein